MRISDWSSDVCSSDLSSLELFIGRIGTAVFDEIPSVCLHRSDPRSSTYVSLGCGDLRAKGLQDRPNVASARAVVRLHPTRVKQPRHASRPLAEGFEKGSSPEDRVAFGPEQRWHAAGCLLVARENG